jgi:uncharacterized protein (DUF952 family)
MIGDRHAALSDHLFHIATAADWSAAQRSGVYTTSTRGVTLDHEGFIHAARREQVAEVWKRYYADAGEPLVLLTVDTGRLTSPWQADPVGDTTYPHVYGPINTGAVVRAQPLDARGGTGSFTGAFVGEMFVRIALFVAAMALAFVGSAIGGRADSEWAGFAGAVAGLAAGLVVMVLVLRRRGRRPPRRSPSST